jgi:DNA mismatch repair protein MutS
LQKKLLLDLGIISAVNDDDSLLKKFDFTITEGGRLQLKALLFPPAFNFAEIEAKQEAIKAICSNISRWPVNWDNQDIQYIREYTASNRIIVKPGNGKIKSAIKSFYTVNFKKDAFFYAERGVKLVLLFFKKILVARLEPATLPPVLAAPVNRLYSFIARHQIDFHFQKDRDNGLDAKTILRLDNVFRLEETSEIKQLLDCLFELEAFISTASAAIKFGLNFPQVSLSASVINIKGLFHPLLNDCTKNDFETSPAETLLFLTGPNMSGKSTFLKSLGLCIYLAHIGLPVPAAKADMPFFDEMYSSINSTDNITNGYSQFKAELNQVKEIAQSVAGGKRVFAVIDELFKGTNLADAFDCSKKVITLLSAHKNVYAVISSHITELHTETVNLPGLSFKCFDGELVKGEPIFKYVLQNGVSNMRLGYYLLKQEGIIELLSAPK